MIRQFDLLSPILAKWYLFSKSDTVSLGKLGTEKGMLKSSLREKIQRYCQGKVLSMVVSVGMSSSQKGGVVLQVRNSPYA